MTRLLALARRAAATPPPHKPADNDDDYPPSVPVPQRMPVPVNDPRQPDRRLFRE